MPRTTPPRATAPRAMTRRAYRALAAKVLLIFTCVGVFGASTGGAAELTVTAVQGDGLTVEVGLCVAQRSLPFHRCKAAAGDGEGVRFVDLAAGKYVVLLDGDVMWNADPVDIELTADSRHSVTVELTPMVDFEALASTYRLWEIRLHRLSGWGDGGTIEISGATTGRAAARWRQPPPRVRDTSAELELTPAEHDRLVSLLEGSRLFDGGHAGTDRTRTDGSFDTLRVSNGLATALLVTSGNPTFAVGDRRDLLRFIDELWRRLEGRGDGPR